MERLLEHQTGLKVRVEMDHLKIFLVVATLVTCGCQRIDHVARQKVAAQTLAEGSSGKNAAEKSNSVMESKPDSVKDSANTDSANTETADSAKPEARQTGASSSAQSTAATPDNSKVDEEEVVPSKEAVDSAQTNSSTTDIQPGDSASNAHSMKPAVPARTKIDGEDASDPVKPGTETQSANSSEMALKATSGKEALPKKPAKVDDSDSPGRTSNPPLPTGNAYFGVRLDTKADAAKIGYLRKNGPAEKAGMQIGDVLVAINGKLVPDTSSLAAVVNASEVGDEMKVVLSRKGKYKIIQVTLGSRANPSGE